ncbi:MKI67 FHA domain-interacting nucleolar phosphoprotein isoform X2 [Nilaparvata lugens]|uniref:MKI67 FHA domain-interacting nucleolar phosphoprotein isoform X2 n=1 Tax=Nilaparvata lugens TaxID=108931 RepID=UPI00193D619E|nr:MKI67 FHA domain-interacting nucleolar phosphoprotein isoform X2 [Nilaparvata lugens]
MKKQVSLPSIVKTKINSKVKDKLFKKKKFRLLHKKRELKQLVKNRGVVHINHIPHGFYEEELFKYFSQFGVLTAVKVPRSNKTGNAKGCAFVEFDDKDVAQVAADAMNNYLMYDCLLKTKYIAPEGQKPIAFDRNGKPWVNRSPTFAADMRRKADKRNKEKPVTDLEAFAKKTRSSVAKLHRKLTSRAGIDYEFQINDDAQLLKVTKKPEDRTPTDDGDDTDDDIKVKKLKKTSKTDLAQAAVKKAIHKGKKKVLQSDTKKTLENTTKAIKNTTKVMKNNTKATLKKVVVNKKEALKNTTKEVIAGKKSGSVKTLKEAIKDTGKKIIKKSAKPVKEAIQHNRLGALGARMCRNQLK